MKLLTEILKGSGGRWRENAGACCEGIMPPIEAHSMILVRAWTSVRRPSRQPDIMRRSLHRGSSSKVQLRFQAPLTGRLGGLRLYNIGFVGSGGWRILLLTQDHATSNAD